MFNRGLALRKSGKDKEAIECFNKSLKLKKIEENDVFGKSRKSKFYSYNNKKMPLSENITKLETTLGSINHANEESVDYSKAVALYIISDKEIQNCRYKKFKKFCEKKFLI